MSATKTNLESLSKPERDLALTRFQMLRPFLEDGVALTRVAQQCEIPIRTAWRWVERYRRYGLAGLARKSRTDKGARRIPLLLKEAIEGLALQKPLPSVATVHRKAADVAKKLGLAAPSYSAVYSLVRKLDPALVSIAHEGSRAYEEKYDLIHRTEAAGPNAIWQADHTLMDIWIKDDKGVARKPWLTIVLDDYSRAVAGYFLSFSAPSALQTALALRQAIWRKEQPGWHICGIPESLYTDHGSDFTSRHIEQVTADLKIRMIFSGVGKPRGRGKVERFFSMLNQKFLPHLPGSLTTSPSKASMTITALANELERFILNDYHIHPHSSTKVTPQQRWESGGFLPQMPESLEQLDLLLLSVGKTRRVQQDGIQFMGMRFISPTLAAYVGEQVLVRYDPRDIAEVRLFYNDRFLCRAICQEIAGETVALREIVNARKERRTELRQTLKERQRTVDSLLEARRWNEEEQQPVQTRPQKTKSPAAPALKRYLND